MLPVNAVTALLSGPDFQVGTLDPAGAAGTAATTATPGASSGGFAQMLTDKVSQLDGLQQNATAGSQALATGQASDVSAVVMQVEQASLAMQLATQVRNKAVDAYTDLMHTQI